MRRSGAEGPQRGRYTCGTTDTNMTREEDLMKQVEELKRKIREVEEEKEEIRRRRKEAWGGEYMMRESGAGGIASRAIGSVMHVGLQGQEGMHVKLQSQMVVADVNFFSGAGGSAMHVGLQGQEGMHVKLQPQMVAADVIFFSGAGGSAMHVGLQGQEDYHGGPLSEVFGSPESTEVDYHGGPLSEVSGSREWLQTNHVEMPMFSLSEVPSAAPATGGTVFPTASVGGTARAPVSDEGTMALTAASATSGTVPSAASVRGEVGGRESSAGTTSSDAIAKAAALTGDTAAPDASVERVAGKLTLKAGSCCEIFGERGASTHPFDPGIMFPLEVRYASSSSSSTSNSNSSSSSSSSSSSHKDVAYAGALLRPFDPGKRCHRGARMEKAVRGLDLPFDRGKTWRRMQHGG